MRLNKSTIVLVVVVALFAGEDATATNWLKLQGTEGPDSARVRVWGFLQPTHQKDYVTTLF